VKRFSVKHGGTYMYHKALNAQQNKPQQYL